jgi:tRNA pseudouridine38-40 synthase
MPTYKLRIEYEGTRYSGWQAQGNTPKTVQGRLQFAAAQIFRASEIGGSGRTDAGVHAAGQVAHLKVEERIAPAELVRKLNDLLPHDIHVLDAERADDRFHARHDAEMRFYLYQIARRRSAFAKPFVWWIRDPLDVTLMSQAAASLPGMHDYGAFCDRRAKNESTRVLVDLVEIGVAGDLILIRMAASHFLWKMVRKIVAALVETGRGSISPADVASYLDRADLKWEPTAPPSGLFLEAVLYPGETFARALEPLVPITTVAPIAGRGRTGERKRR